MNIRYALPISSFMWNMTTIFSCNFCILMKHFIIVRFWVRFSSSRFDEVSDPTSVIWDCCISWLWEIETFVSMVIHFVYITNSLTQPFWQTFLQNSFSEIKLWSLLFQEPPLSPDTLRMFGSGRVNIVFNHN